MSSPTLTTIKVYIDIDSFMDTKLPIYMARDKDKLSKSLQTGEYYKRVNTGFDWYPREEFEEDFKKRTKQTLALSVINKLYLTINSFIKEGLKVCSMEGTTSTVDITVNFHPYELTENEYSAFMEGFKHKVLHNHINFVNKPLEELTPHYLQSFDLIAMHNFIDWVDRFSENEEIIKTSMHGSLILTPIDIDTYDKETDGDLNNIVSEIEGIFSLLCKVRFLPLEVYSVPV